MEIMRHRILHERIVRMGCTLPESKKLSKRGMCQNDFKMRQAGNKEERGRGGGQQGSLPELFSAQVASKSRLME